jgi:hypothetical protein
VRDVYLEPSDANVRALLDREVEGPLVMVNLLRFRAVADYAASPELAPPAPISGRHAYDRYIRHTEPFLTRSGGSVELMGAGGAWFVGPADERWDLVLLVRQSSLDSFFAFATDEAYLAGTGHRTAALEDSRLLPVAPLPYGPEH